MVELLRSAVGLVPNPVVDLGHFVLEQLLDVTSVAGAASNSLELLHAGLDFFLVLRGELPVVVDLFLHARHVLVPDAVCFEVALDLEGFVQIVVQRLVVLSRVGAEHVDKLGLAVCGKVRGLDDFLLDLLDQFVLFVPTSTSTRTSTGTSTSTSTSTGTTRTSTTTNT